MTITDNEAMTLLGILTAVAAGRVTANEQATAGALAARLSRGDDRFTPEHATAHTAAAERPQFDAAAIFAKRKAVREAIAAAHGHRMSQVGGVR